MIDLAGRGAVVTGGGRGIGAAIAQALAGVGAAVAVSARTESEIEEVAAELRAAGHRAVAIPCDVTEPEQVAALKETAESELGSVDILVNNAGIVTTAPLAAMKLDKWNQIFAVNVTGTFLCTQAFLPAMAERGWGRVINIASIAGKMGAPYISAYAASKHAVVGFTRAVATEVATTGVTVNAVCPGYVDTSMLQNSLDRIVDKAGIERERAMASVEGMSPQKRVFQTDEVAFVALSLCGDGARGVNAQSLVIDGGAVQS